MVSVQAPPPAIAVIAGDALQNLRSALDHLAYQLVLVGTGKPGPFYHVYFPIFDSAPEYEAKKQRQVKGMRKEAKKAIDTVAPYKGGNDTVWLIHSLNKIDKHRLLVTVGSAFRSLDLGSLMSRAMAKRRPPEWGEMPILSAFFRPANRLCPLKPGDELYIGAVDDEVDEHLQFAFDVAFSEPKVAESEPILETLQQMSDLVDSLLTNFGPLLR